MMEWISVKDHPPEKEGRYLVYVPWHDNHGWCGVSTWRFNNYKKPNFDDTNATYWMPLPDAPK